MAPKPKGKWATQATVDLGSIIQGLAYLGGQMETASKNRSGTWQNETDAFLSNFTPPSGIGNMTDLKSLNNLEKELRKMDDARTQGPYADDYLSDTSREYHQAAITAVERQTTLVTDINDDYDKLRKSNDKIYISGPQTNPEVNYNNLLAEDGELVFPSEWVLQDEEGHNYLESSRFLQTYLDVAGNNGATTDIGRTMNHMFMLNLTETSRQLSLFKGNSGYARIVEIPEFSYMKSGRDEIEGIRNYASQILSNIEFTNGDKVYADPELAMHYHSAVRDDAFSQTDPLFVYKGQSIVRENQRQQTYREAIDDKHTAWLSLQSVINLTGSPTTKLEGGVQVPAFKVPVGTNEDGTTLYNAYTETEIDNLFAPQADTLEKTIRNESDEYFKMTGHRYEKFDPTEGPFATGRDMAPELEKRKESIADIKEYNEEKKKRQIASDEDAIKEWTKAGGAGLDYNLMDEDRDKLFKEYRRFLQTKEGESFIEKEGVEWREGMGGYMWLNSLTPKELSKILNKNLTKGQ